MKINQLIPIGAKLSVDKSKIKNELPERLLNDLPQIINGDVVDYKLNDGMDIGYVIMTDNNQKLWIFSRELNEQTKKEYNIKETNQSTTLIPRELTSQINKVEYEINGNRSIKTLANPINIITWFIFTLKDIF